MTKPDRKRAQQTVLLALACGATVENAAHKAGLCDRTVYRWLKTSEFRARLQEIRAELFKRTAGMLTGAGMVSVKVLMELQQDGSVSASVRCRAARDVLELGIRFRESTAQEERISVLEERVGIEGPRRTYQSAS